MNDHISTEKEKKHKRRIRLLIVALIAILLTTAFVFRYTHPNRIGRENYSVYFEVEDEVCTVIVNGTLPSKLRVDIDSLELYEDGANYTVWPIKNVTFYIFTQKIELTPETGFEEKETSITYWIRLENYSFSRAMITFYELHYELHYSENGPWREYLFPIEINEHFTSFFMQFETFKEDGE